MPRTSRVLSSTGIYHVILRSINKQVIFEEEEDFQFFIHLLHKVKERTCFKLYAYCLMHNHVHLLLRTDDAGDSLESIFKRLESRFVLWYNHKYARTGHLFQDRFLSEPVENESYFKAAFRYIHQNPMKAGLENSLYSGYFWSSYSYYTDACLISNFLPDMFAGRQPLIDTAFPISVFGSRSLLLDFCSYSRSADICMEYETPPRKKGNTDPEAMVMLCDMAACRNMEEFKSLSRDAQYYYIHELNKAGISQRQLSRVTGFSRTTISRICDSDKQT